MRILRPLLWLTLLLALAVAALAWLAFDRAPAVAARDDLSPADVDRAVTMVRQHDPRRLRPGQTRWLALSERDADLLLHHAARRWLATRTQVRLQPGHLQLRASLPAPAGVWLNAELGLRQTTGVPEVESLRLGRLPLPPGWAAPLLRHLVERQGLQAEGLLDAQWLERVILLRGRLVAAYRFSPDTLQQLRAAVLPPAEHERLRAHAERLARWRQDHGSDSATVAELLRPLLALAAERSRGSGEAASEHRAALLTATAFAAREPLGAWLGNGRDWPRPAPLHIVLQGRPDLALHFLVSSVLAAESGTPLADAVGLWKELADARRGGSGFSFQDLAADRAGARFGELALRSPQRLRPLLDPAAGEDWLLPPVQDLPETLPEAVFVERYGGVGGAGHRRLAAEIEARLDRLTLYR